MQRFSTALDQRRNVQLLLGRPLFDLIEDWRREQPDIPSRSQAIEELVRLGLAANAEQNAT